MTAHGELPHSYGAYSPLLQGHLMCATLAQYWVGLSKVIKFEKISPYPTRTHLKPIIYCYTEHMQNIATKVFIYASVMFGIIGMLIVITAPGPDQPDTDLSKILIRLLFASVFVILPSFALSIAGKYLNGK